MEIALGKTDIRALKRDAFRAILDTEARVTFRIRIL
jgi:hypothetical protein